MLGVWIVRRHWAIASLVALLCALGLVTGCVSSSEEEAQTPDSAATVVNSAVQTNEDGETVPAPGQEEAPPAEGGEGEGGGEADPAVAAGLEFYDQTCASCHMAGGTGGFGPALVGQGLTADEIEEVVVNGQGAMPGGLASGDDLANVVAYVESLQ